MFRVVCLILCTISLLFALRGIGDISEQQYQREPSRAVFQRAEEEPPGDPEEGRRRKKYSKGKPEGNDEDKNKTRHSLEDKCTICLDYITNLDKYTLPCRHKFHGKCLKHWFDMQGSRKTCPCCRAFVRQAVFI